MERKINQSDIADFKAELLREERSQNTVGKYIHDVESFRIWLGEREVTKEILTAWKAERSASVLSAVTVNTELAALHSFFSFMGWTDLRMKYLRVQRRVFRDSSRELSKTEFERLVSAAQNSGNIRLALILETICATGIRVSELQYISLEAVRCGKAEVRLKGKVRSILIPNRLARKLLKYAQKQKIASGEIFVTKSGRSLSRRQIWGEMKRLCKAAGVDESKVFPHNLRHLFARTFYKAYKDIVRLADVLGHSAIETTRIYLISSGSEHARQLDHLGLVS